MNTIAALFAGTLLLAVGAIMHDGAVITNSGSTNFPGYTIKVWDDGTVAPQASSRSASSHISRSLARQFFDDLKKARHGNASIEGGCMKSVSFGSTTKVTWHGWTSPDLECPGGPPISALATDVHQIVAQAGVQTSRRIPMLPHEPRRVEASPSPDSHRQKA